MPSHFELAMRLVLAAVLSGLVGLEREITDKTAGLRTHITVALGAAVLGMVSAYSFDAFGNVPRNDSSYQVDVTRIASQIAPGIGFLGAGAIVKYGASVRGLTTAGSLWVVAAIGLACSFGSYFVASMATGVLLVSLVLLRGPDRWIGARLARRRESVVLTLTEDADPGAVITALRDVDEVHVKSVSYRTVEGHRIVEAFVAAGVGVNIETALMPLVDRPDVAGLEVS